MASVETFLSNYLESRDLSIKTASSNNVKALQQFADNYAYRIRSGTTVQTSKFGVLAYGIRTNAIDISKLDKIGAQILKDNRPFISQAEIRHISWLTKAGGRNDG